MRATEGAGCHTEQLGSRQEGVVMAAMGSGKRLYDHSILR